MYSASIPEAKRRIDKKGENVKKRMGKKERKEARGFSPQL